jgi:hypothetical protein
MTASSRPDRSERGRSLRRAVAASAAACAAIALWAAPRGLAQAFDICGCAGAASLGAFDTLNAATWPPGTEQGFRFITLPLPDDGVLVFDSVNIAARPSDNGALGVSFRPNARNTPVTLLVKGNLTIGPNTATGLNLNGSNGSPGQVGDSGKGGDGGPGGFRGGDGTYQLVNFAARGGAGLGPVGGAPGTTSPLAIGASGVFLGNLQLLPMIGGSGGGGGASTTTASGCSAGGGGGGGGAILVAANGTVTLNGYIAADGGNGGGPNNSSCASGGGAGSGGAIRIVASAIQGTGNLWARSGIPSGASRPVSSYGRIRLEAISNTLPANNTDPIASRSSVPGPVAPPVTPTVRITGVGGVAAPAFPVGGTGLVDITLPTPGTATVDVATSAVPSGTIVEVYVKPRVGGPQVTLPVTLLSCDGAGNCSAQVSTSLAAGTYTVEARATFQTP